MEITSAHRHYAVIEPANRKVTIEYDGTVIASSDQALSLKEVAKSVLDTVYYFPLTDILVDLFPENHRQSYCPLKGDATYWNLSNPTRDYFALSYEDPLPECRRIKQYIAFNSRHILTILGTVGNK